jgi:3-oxoacyl-[acyl-carrier-protein] synthase II
MDRKGFVVSEGAAALIVTTRGFAEAKNLPVRAVIEGVGMTSDANHFVAPHLPTIITCIRQSLAAARVEPGDVQAVNAHAASTSAGDKTEVNALKEIFGAGFELPISANKSQIGHTMGASSAIELILAIEGMKRSLVLPTLNYLADPKLHPMNIVDSTRPIEHHRVLSNSFGFGGCNVCLVVSG